MTVDFSALEKCAMERAKVLVPGVIGMNPETAEGMLSSSPLKAK